MESKQFTTEVEANEVVSRLGPNFRGGLKRIFVPNWLVSEAGPQPSGKNAAGEDTFDYQAEFNDGKVMNVGLIKDRFENHGYPADFVISQLSTET